VVVTDVTRVGGQWPVAGKIRDCVTGKTQGYGAVATFPAAEHLRVSDRWSVASNVLKCICLWFTDHWTLTTDLGACIHDRNEDS